jgi:hypothetical protein
MELPKANASNLPSGDHAAEWQNMDPTRRGQPPWHGPVLAFRFLSITSQHKNMLLVRTESYRLRLEKWGRNFPFGASMHYNRYQRNPALTPFAQVEVRYISYEAVKSNEERIRV